MDPQHRLKKKRETYDVRRMVKEAEMHARVRSRAYNYKVKEQYIKHFSPILKSPKYGEEVLPTLPGHFRSMAVMKQKRHGPTVGAEEEA